MPIVGLPGLDRVVELADQEIGGRGGHSQETMPIVGQPFMPFNYARKIGNGNEAIFTRFIRFYVVEFLPKTIFFATIALNYLIESLPVIFIWVALF